MKLNSSKNRELLNRISKKYEQQQSSGLRSNNSFQRSMSPSIFRKCTACDYNME